MTHPFTRRDFLAAVAGSAAVSAIDPLTTLAESLNSPAPKTRPNVLFIAVDDLRPQLGCYGQSQMISPNIDRLAAGGVIFDRTYCQEAICAASRCSLLSGCRPDTTGIYGLKTPLRKAMPDVLSLPEHFKNSGYETLSIGKIYHHGHDDEQGWSSITHFATPGRSWRDYQDPENVQLDERDEKSRGPAWESAGVPDNAYKDGRGTDYAIEQLRRLKYENKPFFLAMGYYKPHLPFNAPQKYWDMFDPEKIELPENLDWPKGSPELAWTSWGELRSYYDIPKQGPVSEQQMRTLIHGYYACVAYIDAQIGRLLNELKNLELDDDTIICLWGDHGWKLGEYNAWCKHTNYELDVHVPMIFSVPGMQSAGRRSAALSEFVDIYPTLAELCGLEIPQHCEGTSLVPVLDKPTRPWKSAAFSQYPRAGNIMGYSMRTDRYRYTQWQDRDTGAVQEVELYDLKRDPGSNTNVAAHSDYAETVKTLAIQMKAGWQGALPKM